MGEFMTSRLSEHGFSMVEIMVYMAMTAILMVTITSFMVDVTAHGALTRKKKDVQFAVHRITSIIAQDIRRAQSIEVVSDSTELRLVRTDNTAITYRWNNDPAQLQLLYEEGSGSGFVALSSDNVKITSLSFSNLTTAPSVNPDEVTVALTAVPDAAIGNPASDFIVSARSTYVRRNSYY